MSDALGRVLVVSTPIGNLGDLSPRAVEALGTADLVACEDTRRTRALLSHAGISAGHRLMSLHAHNEASATARVIEHLEAGRTVAVVSDAGTPLLSDPGERLVAAAAEAGFEVLVVPGPSAVTAALVASGLPAGRFCFEGFLPRKGGDRRSRLAELAGERRTTVIFESPRRLTATLDDLCRALGPDRRVAVCRELTKLHEETWRGTLGEAVERAGTGEARGEHVLVVEGAPAPAPASEADIEAALRAALAAGSDRRAAVAAVAAELSVPRRAAYEVAIRL